MDDKRELSRRVNELVKIRKNLNDKISQMEKQQEILLKNTNGHKVSELMGYVDKQRNIYRNNIQQLLNKLDPDGRTLEELDKNQFAADMGQPKPMQSGPSSKVTANVRIKNINESHPEVKVIKTYTPSDYRGLYIQIGAKQTTH